MPEPTEPLAPTEAGLEEAAPGKKMSKGLLRLLAALLPLVLLPASAGAYLAYDYYPRLARTAAAVGFTSGLADEEENDKPKPIEFGQFQVLPDLLVNPAGTNGKRFLMVNIGMESKSGKVFEEIQGKDAVVRDIILQKLGARTVEELSSVATREEIKDTQNLKMKLTVNGEVRQQGHTGDMVFSVAHLIAYASRIFTLLPGDLLYTGTPEGVGPVQDGDVLEATITGLPTLRVKVRRDAEAPA